jgi:predicted glycosyltransferase
MAGGGADAYPLFDALLNAVPVILEAGPCHIVMVTGPFLPAEQQRTLSARAQDLPVDVLISVSDPVSYAATADLVVAMAGYNTTAEILSVGTPALLVPRGGPSAEQQMRARLFAERGWVEWLRPQDLSADPLGRAVTQALYEPWATTPVRPPDLSGRTVAAGQLIDALAEARPSHAIAVANGEATAKRRPIPGVRDDDYLFA